MEKKKLYELLGAKKFQEIVLRLEKLKFKVENFLFPNNKLYKIGEKKLEKRKQRELKKAKSEDQKKEILNVYKYRKLKMKRQLANCQNDNYHLNITNVDEFKKYLEWNKKVHKGGLIKNIVFILAMIPIIILSGGIIGSIAEVILVGNILTGIINFECVNLQNYNLLRYEEKYDRLKKAEGKIAVRNIRKYKDANEIIAKTMEKSIDIPTVDDIMKNVQTDEQKKQILALIENEQRKRNKYKDDAINNSFHK